MTNSFKRQPYSKTRALAMMALGMTLSFPGCSLGPERGTAQDADADAEPLNPEAGWSEFVQVGGEFEPCVSYRARIQGEYLVIEAKHRSGWHSYALDNKVRAAARLAGASSLGVELPTSFEVQGATVVGTWLQTPPEDLSDTEIQWYTFGFNGTAMFAAKLKHVGTEPVVIAVRGQVCDANSCRDVDAELRLDPASHRTTQALDTSKLIPEQKTAKKE